MNRNSSIATTWRNLVHYVCATNGVRTLDAEVSDSSYVDLFMPQFLLVDSSKEQITRILTGGALWMVRRILPCLEDPTKGVYLREATFRERERWLLVDTVIQIPRGAWMVRSNNVCLNTLVSPIEIWAPSYLFEVAHQEPLEITPPNVALWNQLFDGLEERMRHPVPSDAQSLARNNRDDDDDGGGHEC